MRAKNPFWRVSLAVLWLLTGCSLAPSYTESLRRVDTFQEPLQTAVQEQPVSVENLFGTCELKPRADIVMQGRVLHTRSYDLDWRAVCSPLDIALGWGPMADPDVDQWVTWSQSRRWYFFHLSPGAPFSVQDVAGHSSNVHILPANHSLSRALLNLQEGDVVLLEGELVDLGVELLGLELQTTTSLRRSDTGAGACEILYVQRLIVDGREYR